jgi:hypothetical protein
MGMVGNYLIERLLRLYKALRNQGFLALSIQSTANSILQNFSPAILFENLLNSQ